MATSILVVLEVTVTAILTIVRMVTPTLQATITTTIGAAAATTSTTVTQEWETARFWKERLAETTPVVRTITIVNFHKVYKNIVLNFFNGITVKLEYNDHPWNPKIVDVVDRLSLF